MHETGAVAYPECTFLFQVDISRALSKFHILKKKAFANTIAERIDGIGVTNIAPSTICNLMSALGSLGLADKSGIVKQMLNHLEEHLASLSSTSDFLSILSGASKFHVSKGQLSSWKYPHE